jgi:hypothetical protein
LGDEQGEGCEGVVVDFHFAVGFEAVAVFFEEPNEEECADALVAVVEGMAFDDKIEQMSRLLFDAVVEVMPVEGLHDIAEDAGFVRFSG